MTTLLGFDLETTGVTQEDTFVQASFVLRSDHADRVLINELVNPCRPIDPGASAVHRITDAMVATKPDYLISAWKYRLLADQFPGAVLVTFNGRRFDVPMIDRALGYAYFADLPHIDVLQFARRFFPDAKGSTSSGGRTLGELYQLFLNRPLSGAHDAATDVIATLDLLEAMRKKAAMSLEDLVSDQRTYRPYAIMPIGKYSGQLVDDVPVSWARFMADKDLDGDLRETVELILRRGA
jgi:DNA polymerase III epsilon subunit-like protein